MAVTHGTPDVTVAAAARAGRLTGGGTTGNERLTTTTGAALLVLLAVIGLTLLQLRQLLSVHMFVGMLLIGPVALKLGSTGYRFVCYYARSPAYRHEGPPAAPLRAIAPMVVISTIVVLATGVALLFAGVVLALLVIPEFGAWLHDASVHHHGG
jgi:hypothetical protein